MVGIAMVFLLATVVVCHSHGINLKSSDGTENCGNNHNGNSNIGRVTDRRTVGGMGGGMPGGISGLPGGTGGMPIGIGGMSGGMSGMPGGIGGMRGGIGGIPGGLPGGLSGVLGSILGGGLGTSRFGRLGGGMNGGVSRQNNNDKESSDILKCLRSNSDHGHSQPMVSAKKNLCRHASSGRSAPTSSRDVTSMMSKMQNIFWGMDSDGIRSACNMKKNAKLTRPREFENLNVGLQRLPAQITTGTQNAIPSTANIGTSVLQSAVPLPMFTNLGFVRPAVIRSDAAVTTSVPILDSSAAVTNIAPSAPVNFGGMMMI